ncbi:hypothetical protein BJB45_11705 [Halomonas huangheensis]|uniref:Uncharacterized protein n=1 Tax=Halomonas huangheensis TaxID=1178482 RepID=W1N8J4_9GAMM|nr:hypothetical protein BJB45_11705 [Halomonas huangheensis]
MLLDFGPALCLAAIAGHKSTVSQGYLISSECQFN